MAVETSSGSEKEDAVNMIDTLLIRTDLFGGHRLSDENEGERKSKSSKISSSRDSEAQTNTDCRSHVGASYINEKQATTEPYLRLDFMGLRLVAEGEKLPTDSPFLPVKLKPNEKCLHISVDGPGDPSELLRNYLVSGGGSSGRVVADETTYNFTMEPAHPTDLVFGPSPSESQILTNGRLLGTLHFQPTSDAGSEIAKRPSRKDPETIDTSWEKETTFPSFQVMKLYGGDELDN